jgi:hypothetical protein
MEWKNTEDKKERDKHAVLHGCRYSELYRLPYWDAALQLVIDPMHALLEGIVHNYYRHTLKLTKVDVTDEKLRPAFDLKLSVDGVIGHDQNDTTRLKTEVGKITDRLKLAFANKGGRPHQTEVLRNFLSSQRLPALKFVSEGLRIVAQDAKLIFRSTKHPEKVTMKAYSRKDYANVLVDWVCAVCL